MRNLHACFVSPNAYPVIANRDHGTCGGAEVQQMLLARAFTAYGYRVTFVVGDFGQPRIEQHMGINVVRGPFRYLGGSNVYFVPDTLGLVLLLRRIKADVYLLKTPPCLACAIGVYRRLWGGRFVKIMASDSDCQVSRWGVSSWLYRMGLRCVDHVVFQSEHQRQLARCGLGIEGKVIRNIAHEACSGERVMPRDIDVLWVGSCREIKRPHLLFEMAENMPDVHFSMVMSVSDNLDLYRSIERRAKAIPNVRFEGVVKYADVAAYYRRSRVLAFTSELEGFPNVFLQAWQAMIPVVSLSINPDGIIDRERAGCVSGSVERMKEDIHRLLQDDELREHMGYNGWHYVQQYHSVAGIVREYAALLEAPLRLA